MLLQIKYFLKLKLLKNQLNYYFLLNFSVNAPANIPAGKATIPILKKADNIAKNLPIPVIG